MHERSRVIPRLLTALIAVGTLAALTAAMMRLRVENRNRRIEIGVEYAEADTLAQSSHRPLASLLRDMKAQSVSALILSEDTPGALESIGLVQPVAVLTPAGEITRVGVEGDVTLTRIQTALKAHGFAPQAATADTTAALPDGATLFLPVTSGPTPTTSGFTVDVDYAHLRTLGLGLPPAGVRAAHQAGLQILGRVANFPGVTPASARAVLTGLRQQGASLVIFNGDDVLGYRGMEKTVAGLLDAGRAPASGASDAAPVGLTYGEVEFGKQKGDAILVGALHGDYVRVHSVQVAEMGQMDENALIDRYTLAARERNIRFLYVRLLTQAGADAVTQNIQFLKKITRHIAHGSLITGGGMDFGPAHPFQAPGVPIPLYGLMGLGVAASTVWMLRELCPLPERAVWLLTGALTILCVGLSLAGQTGRALVALLAGVAFPAIACLQAFPRPVDPILPDRPAPQGACLSYAIRAIVAASAVTALGIAHVIGLLASREYIVKSSQYLGIKAQHGVPILIIALVALIGISPRGETWPLYRERVTTRLRSALDEPARYGLLLLGIVAMSALFLILARTGNDSGVAASGIEMKGRALLDRILPVRPRTKEFLVGHPAFVLALAWWLRGRRRLAIPCFVVGSIGQVSLLNTFCHIHTPLIDSLWRGGLGLILGALIGAALFLLLERLLPTQGRPAVPGRLNGASGSRPVSESGAARISAGQ